MNTRLRTALIPLALMATTPAFAATVTLDFLGENTVSTGSADIFFFNPEHTVTQDYAGTGISNATNFTFDLQISDILSAGAFVNFEARANEFVLGNFTISDSDPQGLFSFSFDFTDNDPIGDDYSIGLFVTNTVPGGDGSVEFFTGPSSVTISGDAISPVPLPAGGLLLLSGLAAVGGFNLRNKRKA